MSKSSLGEKIIAQILNEYSLKYFQDENIAGLRGIKDGELRFDFIIPFDQSCNSPTAINDKCCVIEYNGIFHYYAIEGKTNENTLAKQQMNDLIKDDHCRKENINILWLSYWQTNKQIKYNILDFLLMNCRNFHNYNIHV